MRRELYVGNLPFETTEEDLRRLFSVSGQVQAVHIIVDKVNGKSKGCGYVKMTTEAEAKDAILSLDGALLDNRKITVSEAREQKPAAAAPPRRSSAGRTAPGTGVRTSRSFKKN